MSVDPQTPLPDLSDPTLTPATSPAHYRHWWNWLTVLGLGLAAVACLVGAVLLLVDLMMESSTIYMSLLTLGVVPMLIVGGLGMAVAGVVLQWGWMRLSGSHSFLWFDPLKQRRFLWLWASVIVVFLIVSGYGGYQSFGFIESEQFCGEVCHSVMHPEYTAHANSPHARVSCLQCHAGPGLEHHITTKIRGLHQVVAITTGDYEKPLATPLEHLRPARDICVQCHWPQKFVGTTVQDRVYFLPDEQNTPHRIKLMMHVGGGMPGTASIADQRPSIHWHITGPNKVFYAAADRQRQDIQWVKVVDGKGTETVYRSDDLGDGEATLLAQHEIREMDCIDCHNRAVHVFQPPQRLLNQAMLSGAIDPSLPYVKQQGLKLLAADYATGPDARVAITAALQAYYQATYPDVVSTKQPAIARAAATMGDLYEANIFPTMKADWRAHPDNIGHTYSQGCFRCHDGSMKNDAGVAIASSCTTCHDIAAQGEGLAAPPMTNSQDFIHPEDIDDLWQGAACTDCHTGAGTND